ncbi:MAG: PAP2 family protein [Gammaproteobacteria bacterium]
MQFRKIHYALPVLAMLAGIFLQYAGVDVWFEHFFYDETHHLWPYDHNWLASNVIHRGGQFVMKIIALGMLIFAISSLFIKKLKIYRKASWYLVLASFTSAAIIGELKSITHIYSPWDLLIFGGKYPHIRLFDAVASSAPVGHAFPAGHAGGGFALLSFYFLYREKDHSYSYYFLVVALSIGLIFGIDQDIRGAHMLSHDLFSFAICWLTCMLWTVLFFTDKPIITFARSKQLPG